MDIPKRIWPPILIDDFRYRGKNFLPGAKTIPDEWSIVSGLFSTSDEKQLICTSPGILQYIGTSIDQLLTGIMYPNFAWVIRLFGQEGLDFSLRVRENSSADTYIAIRVKFTTNELVFTNKQSTTTTSFAGDYPLRTNDIDYYSIELWTLNESDYWVLINGNPVFPIDAVPTAPGHDTDYGFSIEVHNVPDNGGRFAKFAVHEIVPYPDIIANNDGSDLYRIFRELIKEAIENPTQRNWSTFLKARKLWENHRNTGKSNQSWEKDGLPIREPLPEEFL